MNFSFDGTCIIMMYDCRVGGPNMTQKIEHYKIKIVVFGR